ncbi:MAG: hypothetical protein IJ202_06210 [Bacteroidales bacterium]|nr:hypothetical protein [Bacteroidales bacterium]
MRHLILIVAAMAAGISANAQIMPDSTAQIVAYWNKGDIQSYDYTHRRYTIGPDGDSTVVMSVSERKTLEVLSVDESGYTLRYSTSDIYSSDPDLTMMMANAQGAGVISPVVFTTNDLGEVDKILDVDNLLREMERSAEDYSKYLWNNLPRSARKAFSKSDIKALLLSRFDSEEKLVSWFGDELGILLAFHGGRYTPDKEHTKDELYPIQPSEGDPIYSHVKVVVPKEYLDDFSAVCIYDSYVDDPRLWSVLLRQASDSGNSLLSSVVETLKANTGEELSNLTMTYEEFISNEVHLESGWPLFVHYTKSFMGNYGGEKTERLDDYRWSIVQSE